MHIPSQRQAALFAQWVSLMISRHGYGVLPEDTEAMSEAVLSFKALAVTLSQGPATIPAPPKPGPETTAPAGEPGAKAASQEQPAQTAAEKPRRQRRAKRPDDMPPVNLED